MAGWEPGSNSMTRPDPTSLIYYNDLNNLKRVNDVDSFNLYSNFVEEFALSKNAKKRKISNFVNTKIENFNDVVKENDNN